MDNCAFHHSNMVNNYLPQLLMQTGVVLKFQPPYHPQLNTYEYCFHIIKQILRSDSDFTFDHTRIAICDAIIDGVTFEKSGNIFKHCGYIH
jgi:transposase